MQVLVEIVAQGIGIGGILLLGALGLTIIYGVMGVVNLAHGEFIMLGSYVMVLLAGSVSPWLAIGVAALLTGVLGYVLDFGLVRFVYYKPVASMLGTWGLGMVLRQTVLLIFGPELRYVALPTAASFSIGFGVTYSVWRALLVAAAVAAAVVLGLILSRTDFGLKVRAVIENPGVAQSLGLQVSRINREAFTLGCVLAGLAGALVAPLKTVFPGMGLPYLVDAFLVVVLAGLGNVRGVVFWAFLIGLAQASIAIPVNDIAAQIAVWSGALILIALRRQPLTVARV